MSGGQTVTLSSMSERLIGHARCSAGEQNLTAQRKVFVDLGMAEKRIYVDHGLTGTNRERPGLREALAACRAGDTVVVAKANGRLKGKKPRLNPKQGAHVVDLYEADEHTTAELAELFGIARSTVYRAIQCAEIAAI